ncbi:universal stress protein [Ralstonia pickettii]|uniref:universal stress protein n=1 Tax=Ralstonia pickettii TaxID=329 RepID=UPI002D76F5CE|nr:universal stress protein [Ralstonia pickettii]
MELLARWLLSVGAMVTIIVKLAPSWTTLAPTKRHRSASAARPKQSCKLLLNQCDMIVMGSAARTPLGSLMVARLSNQLMRLSRTPVTLIRRVGRPSAVACAGIRAVRSAKFGCNHLRYFLQHSSLFPGQTAGFFAVSFATSTDGQRTNQEISERAAWAATT